MLLRNGIHKAFTGGGGTVALDGLRDQRAFEIDPPAKSEIASAWGVLEVSVLVDITSEAIAGLQVEVVVDAIDGAQTGNLARKAISKRFFPPA